MVKKDLTANNLSDLAHAIYDNYWLPYDGHGDDIETNAILEYDERVQDGMPYLFGETEVSPLEFIGALAELIRFRREFRS